MSDIPEINADKRAFNQILLNLLSNAIKFTEPGGRVTVGVLCDDTRVTVSIQDTGVGIGAADLPRLGDPFFQAQASYDRRHDGAHPGGTRAGCRGRGGRPRRAASGAAGVARARGSL